MKNPIFSKERFVSSSDNETISFQGVVNKTLILFALLLTGFASSVLLNLSLTLVIVSAILAFVVAMVVVFVPKQSPYLAPVYAILEGVTLGYITTMYELKYSGIASQAVLLTFGVLSVLLFIYKTRIIKVTENFKSIIIVATGAIGLIYLVNMVMMFFGSNISFIRDNSMIGIGFSLFVVGIASMNLLLNFDFIEKQVEERAPKYMEWYSAFGLVLTLVWLYLEILRLLSKLNSKN
jgi:uncharacterized YccA/Bax inhibitor family protein